MDSLLNKNIFNEKDLLIHSPDYIPPNILMRMQLRKSSVKDTHVRGVVKHNIGQKRNIKRNKDYKVNKEIVKIRNYFHDIDLNNRLILKYGHFSKNNVNDNDFVKNDMDFFLQQPLHDINDLIIQNDNCFKINQREKPINDHLNERLYRIKHKPKVNSRGVISYDEDVYCNNNVMTIKCVYKIRKKTSDSRIIIDSCQDTYNMEYILRNDSIKSEDNRNDDEAVQDMMAVSSKYNDVQEFDYITPKLISEENKPEMNIFSDKTNFTSETHHITNYENCLSATPREHIEYYQNNKMKKYINKWRNIVIQRREHIMAEQRQETLNNFFDKLIRKKNSCDSSIEPSYKSKLLARDYNTYQHRYKVQKHIIALQKAKLEQQTKLIEELKYNKIIDASRYSLDAMKEDIRKTYYEIDKHLKPKIKCLTNELKIRELEEPSLVLHCLKVPQFLQRMEARAREREEKHAIIRERRRQMEEERIKLKQQAELAKAEMDKEEKMRRIKELREKRKRDRIESIRKKQFAERMRALAVMADLHYERNLMSKYGIRPMRKLIEMKRENLETAKAHYTFQLKKNVFLQWMWHTEDMWFDRNYKAEDFNRKKILKLAFYGLKKNHYEYVVKKQVADDYYDLYVTQLVFRKFKEGIRLAKYEFEMKLKKAISYHNSNLLFKVFTCWRTLPALNALKREQEARKMKWREKVLQVVPDYAPPDD